MTGLSVSTSFVDSLCRNLKASLDLNASIDLKVDNNDISLNGTIWRSIIDAHISTIATQRTLLNGIITNVHKREGEKRLSDKAVGHLQQLQRNVGTLLNGAEEVKDLMTTQGVLEPQTKRYTRRQHNTQPCNPSPLSAPIHLGAYDDRKNDTPLSPSKETHRIQAKRKRDSEECELPASKLARKDAIDDRAIQRDHATTQNEAMPVDHHPSLPQSPVMGDVVDKVTEEVTVEFYDINAEADEAMEKAAHAKEQQERKARGELDKRKRESTGSTTVVFTSGPPAQLQETATLPRTKKRRVSSRSPSLERRGTKRDATVLINGGGLAELTSPKKLKAFPTNG